MTSIYCQSACNFLPGDNKLQIRIVGEIWDFFFGMGCVGDGGQLDFLFFFFLLQISFSMVLWGGVRERDSTFPRQENAACNSCKLAVCDTW